jgi:hypothetical protein
LYLSVISQKCIGQPSTDSYSDIRNPAVNTYIVIAPASISIVEFLPRPDSSYSTAEFWPGIQFLHQQVVAEDIKLFVVQEQPTGHAIHHIGKLFACIKVHADSKRQAVESGLETIRVVFLAIASQLNYGVRIHHDEIVVADVTARPLFKIANVLLETKNGGVESFTTLNEGEYRETQAYIEGKGTRTALSYRFDAVITHDDFHPFYIRFNNATGSQSSNLDCAGRNIRKDIVINLPDDRNPRTLKWLIATVYNEAVTTHDLISSYLLLWQVLEIVESSAISERLLDDETIEAVAQTLESRGISKALINGRILTALHSLRTPSQPERIKDGLFALSPRFVASSDPIQVIGTARKIRGKLVHPLKRPNVFSEDLHRSYLDLRKLVSSFFFSFVSN